MEGVFEHDIKVYTAKGFALFGVFHSAHLDFRSLRLGLSFAIYWSWNCMFNTLMLYFVELLLCGDMFVYIF